MPQTITKHDNNTALKTIYALLIISSSLGIISLGGGDIGNVRLWEVFLSVFVLISFLKSCFDRTLGFLVSPTSLFVIGYFMAVFLSGVNAINTAFWLKRVVLVLAMNLLFYVFYQISTLEEFKLCLKLIIYSGTIFAVLGILDVFIFLKAPNVFRLIHYFDSGGLFFAKSDLNLALFNLIPRARGFFAEPNEFSEYLTLPFGFLLAVTFFGDRKMKRRVIFIIGILIVVLAQLFTLSRGGLLAFSSQFLGLYLIRKVSGVQWSVNLKSTLPIAFVLFALTMGAFMYFDWSLVPLFDTAADRISSTLSIGNWRYEPRLETVQAGFVSSGASLPNFLVGVGAGNIPLSPVREATTTNQFVDVLVATGIIGLSFYVAIILSLFRASHKFMKNRLLSSNNQIFVVFVGAYLSFLGMLFGGLTYPTHQLVFFWLNAGLLLAVCEYGNRRIPRL